MKRHRGPLTAAGGLALVLLLPVQRASAMSCHAWLRLDDAQREAAVYAMIDDAIASNQARKWDINRGALRRCLQMQADWIGMDFDDVCSDSRTAGMQAIQTVFKSYIWNCSG